MLLQLFVKVFAWDEALKTEEGQSHRTLLEMFRGSDRILREATWFADQHKLQKTIKHQQTFPEKQTKSKSLTVISLSAT